MEKGSQEGRLTALRVAQAELCSGNTSGSVYRGLSHGSVMFLTGREVASDFVANEIRTILQKDSPTEERKRER